MIKYEKIDVLEKRGISMLVSEYFHAEVSDHGVFDALLDKDSNFFINIIRLKHSTVPEFIEAYDHINRYFSDIATLLNAADAPDTKDCMYREARKRFTFHEVHGINLGFSKSSYGAGWGTVTSDQVLRDAYQIVKKGSMQPEIFHLVNLFEENVAGDRLSDMIASIIEPHIIGYTKRMLVELGITPESHPEMIWLESGLIKNPFRSFPILLVPEEILHELPIAKDWYEIADVVSKNEAIRREISAEIGEKWEKWASGAQKQYLKDHIFMVPDACERVIDGYKSQELDAIDPREYPEYMAELLFKKIKEAVPFKAAKREPSSFEAAMEIIGIFKDWVENNRGWAEIQDAPTKRREKAVQRFMHLGAKHYIQENNIDLSPESDSGRGPVDIKLSRGNDKTLAEIKLSTNGQYLHGYRKQVQEYGLAEHTRNLIYVYVDLGNSGRLATIKEEHRRNQRKSIPCPELVIIDARKRNAASTYDGYDWDFEIPEE